MSITACIVARNESANLAACVSSIRPVADQIVVLDNGSSDDSAAVARGLGCDVLFRPDVVLGQARNDVMDAARGDWILVVDPDERMDDDGCRALAAATAAAPADVGAFLLPRLTYVGLGRWSHEPALRLWRRDDRVRYGPQLTTHASPAPSIRALGWRCDATSVPLHHLDGLLATGGVDKRERNVALLSREVTVDPGLHTWLGLELAALGRSTEAREAFAIAIEAGRREVEASAAPPHQRREYPLWARLFTADLAVIEGDWHAADRVAERLVAEHPDFAGHARARTIRAEAALQTARHDDAIRHCLEAAAHPPGCAHAHMNLASLLERRDPKRAIHHVHAAIERNPYLLNPRIYFAASGGIAAVQFTFLSSVRTIAEHASVAHRRHGDIALASAWAALAREIVASVSVGDPRTESVPLPQPHVAQAGGEPCVQP